MNPIEALGLVDNVLAQVSMNREQHDKVREAVGVLHQTVLQVSGGQQSPLPTAAGAAPADPPPAQGPRARKR